MIAPQFRAKLRNLNYHFKVRDRAYLTYSEAQLTGRSVLPWLKLMRNSWAYGASFEDSYALQFFEKSPAEISEYVTLSWFYELTSLVNPAQEARVLVDKEAFAQTFQDVLGRPVWTWSELCQIPALPPPSGLVMKFRWGCKGQNIHFFQTPFDSWQACQAAIQAQTSEPQKYIYEAWIPQHPYLAQLHPQSLNSLRMITLLTESQRVKLVAAYLRIGTQGKHLDGLYQGGIFLPIDAAGWVDGSPLDYTGSQPDLTHHPDTGQPLSGFQIPYFEAALALVKACALRLPKLPIVGWDIAIKPDGPCLVEGNNRFAHRPYQMMGQGGYKKQFAPYDKLQKVY